jgi:DNA modification methylase
VNEFHPTQKPPELAARAIANSSERGHIVLDLFMGSGATMVGAEQLGRLCCGMELEPKYVAVALQRMADMGLEPRLIV